MQRLRFGFTCLIATAMVAFVAGCGQETVTVPSVVSTIPAQGATNVAVDTAISATFSMAMNAATVTSSSSVVTGPGGAAVAGAVSYAGSTATFMPAAVLVAGTAYTGTITTKVQTPGGVPLANNYIWSFTTASPAPAVVATVPLNGATNVAIGQVLSAKFSEAMSAATISSTTFVVTGPGGAAVTGAVSYSGLVATFTPTADLANGSKYTATITTGATDLAGTPLVSAYVWSFTTITPAPVVVNTVPANFATGVPVGQVLSASFNEAMDCTTLASPVTTFTLAGPGVVAVAGAVSCSGNLALFTPGADLAVNTLYTATIHTGAKDLAGTPMAANYSWTFRTVPAAAAPTVISTVPLNLATGVPTNQAVSATFSLAMSPGTIDTTTFTLSGPGAVAVGGKVSYVAAGSIATFTPTAALAANTVYTATVTTGAEDLAGTGLAQNFVWSFTTAAAGDTTPPTVVATVPLDGATDVPLNQVVSATFSKAMNPATISGATFSLTGPGSAAVSGLVAYAAIGDTLIFTPAAKLAPSTLFTATITTGVTDLAGNALVKDFVWTFTTGTAVSVIAPELVSTVPLSAATGVPVNQTVSATFSEAMNQLTLTAATFQLTGPGGATIAGTVSYDALSSIATFTPDNPLTASTTYTATVTNGATNLTGTALGTTGAPNPWRFTTGATVILPPVKLGTASLFGAFGGSAGVTNQGIETVINGDLGTTGVQTLITGFHDTTVMVAGIPQCVYTETPLNIGQVNGAIDTAAPPPTVGCPNEGTAVTYAIASQAAADSLKAYNALVAFPNGIDVATLGGGAGELGDRTLAPGIYKAAPGSYGITLGNLTLDGKGDPNAFWVFQMATTLTVGSPQSNRSVLLVNGAQAKNVFWQVGSAATINGILGGGTMEGTIISQAGISISTAGVVAITTINGRAIVLTGPVTMVNTVVNVPKQ